MLHTASVGIYASLVKASLPRQAAQTCSVNRRPEKLLAVNLQWLMDNTPMNSQAKVGAKAKIDQKTVGRIMNMTNSPTLEKLSALANAFGVEAWQLLAPRLGASLYQIDKDRRVVPVRDAGPAEEAAPRVPVRVQPTPPQVGRSPARQVDADAISPMAWQIVEAFDRIPNDAVQAAEYVKIMEACSRAADASPARPTSKPAAPAKSALDRAT